MTPIYITKETLLTFTIH